MRLFLFLLLLLSINAFPQDSYCFVVFGERTDDAEDGVFSMIAANAVKLAAAPAFFINTGDMIPGYTRDTSALINQWLRLETALKDLRAGSTYHAVPGDKDISYDYALPIYKLYVGSPYYSFDEKRDHFIVLDNSRTATFEKMEAPQTAFLRKDLAGSARARYTFCFFHKPYYLKTPKEPSMTRLHALFKQGGVDYVISNGQGRYSDVVRDKIHYVTVGSSDSVAVQGKAADSTFQYLLVEVGAKSVGLKPVYLGQGK